jgi:hypothetical protein
VTEVTRLAGRSVFAGHYYKNRITLYAALHFLRKSAQKYEANFLEKRNTKCPKPPRAATRHLAHEVGL